MDPGNCSEEFVRLLKRHERRLNACVFSLVHNWADAEDILQEVAVDLWRRFAEYDPSRDFGAWACTVAYYQVLSYRKKKGRQYLYFSEESDRLLSEEIAVKKVSELFFSCGMSGVRLHLLPCLALLAPSPTA